MPFCATHAALFLILCCLDRGYPQPIGPSTTPTNFLWYNQVAVETGPESGPERIVMAKITLGPMVGAASGSIGGAVFSHNRYGTYIRRRAIPVTSTTEDALAAKARLTSASQAWQGLSANNKAAWNTWATVNPVTDKLGNPQVLTGHAAYIMLGTRRLQSGSDPSATPPLTAAPAPLTSLTLTADIGLGDVEIAFGPTPTGANEQLRISGCVVDSAGINYVENLIRVLGFTAAAQASPFVFEAWVTAKFGALQVGQILIIKVSLQNDQFGQISAPLRAQATVITT